MSTRLYESDFEETTIERLQKLGYEYVPAYRLPDRPSLTDVLLPEQLGAFLRRTYRSIPASALPKLIAQIGDPDGLMLDQRNERFHKMLVKGFDFGYEVGDETKYIHVTPIDWTNPHSNDFLIVNQLPIDGRMARRPDVILYVNGLPLVVFEFKNPYKEDTTVEDAYTQIRNYTYDIPQLFTYNAFCVISDGMQTLHGMPFAEREYFAAWKSIDGRTIDNNVANSMRTLIEGLFPKERLLTYIRDFIVFMKDASLSAKIGAKYHQYFGIQFAVEESIRATRPEGDRKIGVIWHTQGSGKSVSMLFFAGILIRHPSLNNPTIVIQVDRTDLDNQLYDTFVAGAGVVGHVHHAESAEQLRDLLRNEAGQIIFSTIEKFRLKEGETDHPVLSDRRNLIVIADEAHRTQYDEAGFKGNLRKALPNASYIGFTGTPISFAGRDTEDVFGNVIHTYDMLQSVEDQATVPIYYESRLIPLDLSNTDIDEDYKAIVDQADSDDEITRYRAKWTALEKVVGTTKRLETQALDIVKHFRDTASAQAKGMIVCMSRKICVDLYAQLRLIPDCPQVEVVMTGQVSEDPVEWRQIQKGSKYAHIKNDTEKEEVKAKLRNPDDPLKLVIVRDMWLTGFDAKPLSIMYVDKPMKGHTLMQAIARVNRVFPDKKGGLVVDYIGIATALKEATQKYTQGGGQGQPTFDIQAAVAIFRDHLETARIFFPQGMNFSSWRGMPRVEREDWIAEQVNALLGERQTDFLDAQKKLASAYQLVKHLDELNDLANEVLLYDILATQIRKFLLAQGFVNRPKDIERQVGQLVDESLQANEPLDLFAIAGIDRPDISVLDEAFLADLVEKKHVDLRLKLLEKLLADKIKFVFKQFSAKSKSFLELLEKTLSEYHDRIIQAGDVILVMIEMRKKMEEEVRIREEMGLTEEESTFYDIVTSVEGQRFSNQFIADLVHKVVQAMKKEFRVDWTNPHRQDVFSKVNLAVKMVLMKENITGEQLSFLTKAIVKQAEEQYGGWPMDA